MKASYNNTSLMINRRDNNIVNIFSYISINTVNKHIKQSILSIKSAHHEYNKKKFNN